MSDVARLSVATLERMESVTRDDLRHGVLHVDLTPLPTPYSAGSQPPFSGLHFSRWHVTGSTLLQFPAEILEYIVGYLEPIWLFQVAAAYPQMNDLLGFETANRIWYDAIPPALFVEPENFQDEALVKDRMLAYSKGAEANTTLQLSKAPFVHGTYHYYPVRGDRFVLPELTNMSELALNVDYCFDVVHPRDRRFYPTTPTRIRVMALGGPFQPWLDYRQELAGHLHYGTRCVICLEICGRFRHYKQLWGVLWCDTCYDFYMLNPRQVAEIPGLAKLIRFYPHDTSIHLSLMPVDCQYRPMIDEILRAEIGVDFETATAIQKYLRQLLESSKGGLLSVRIKNNRRWLRRHIVQRVQQIWDRTALRPDDDANSPVDARTSKRVLATKIILHSRERWAPTALVPTFLFPARLLYSSKQFLPDDSKARWLPDPTLALKSSRDVLGAGREWIDQKAKEMLQGLLIYRPGGGVTTWTDAADKWHVQRLKNDLYSGMYLNFGYGGARLHGLIDKPTKTTNRLDIIAKKLRIDPLFPVGNLTEHETRMAVACYSKILQHRCGACPLNNFLIFPFGLEQIVRHHREHHPYDFWLNDKWMIRG